MGTAVQSTGWAGAARVPRRGTRSRVTGRARTLLAAHAPHTPVVPPTRSLAAYTPLGRATTPSKHILRDGASIDEVTVARDSRGKRRRGWLLKWTN